MHDDTNDPRRDESLANDSATARIGPAEAYTLAQGLLLLGAIVPTPPSAPPAQPLTRYRLRLHKDPPLWRFGH
jgi:hypothetical protein